MNVSRIVFAVSRAKHCRDPGLLARESHVQMYIPPRQLQIRLEKNFVNEALSKTQNFFSDLLAMRAAYFSR